MRAGSKTSTAVLEMEGMTYLAIAYFGMLVAIALWTWTVVQRSRRLEQRLGALERATPDEHLDHGEKTED